MKNIVRFLLVLTLLFSLNVSFAQETDEGPKPGWLVFSQNIAEGMNAGKVDALIDSVMMPILKELIDEGILLGCGQLNHAWGDEWNVNFYYITESHTAFIKFWDEFVKRVSERHKGFYKVWAPLLSAHKDNMYSVRHMLMTD